MRAVPLADALMQRWFVRDLDTRSTLITATVAGTADGADRDGLRLADHRSSSTGCCGTSGCTRVALCIERRRPADRDRELPARARLRGTRAYDDDGRPRSCLRRAARSISRCARSTARANDRAARARARHELRHPPQRGDAAATVLFLRRARPAIALITVVIAQLSWRGWVQRAARAAPWRGHSAAVAGEHGAGAAPDRARPAAISSAISSGNTGRSTAASASGTSRRCARRCAASCTATTSSSSPTASPTSTSARRPASTCSGRRAVSSPRSSR